MSTQANDLDLWRALQRGERTAFAKLYERFVRELLRYGYRVNANRELVQDTVQDLFLHLWNTRERLPFAESPRFYLYRSLRNRLVNAALADRLRVTPDGLLLEETVDAHGSSDFDWVLAEHQQSQWQRLHDALQKLPPKQQEAIQLRYHHGFSTEEVARLLEITPQSARNILHRAIQSLRTLLPPSVLVLLMSGWFNPM